MKTGATIAHFAEALPIIRLMKPHSRMKGMKTSGPVIPIEVRKSAPLTATMPPRFVQPKKATNCAAKKTMTM
jgi:hypothetical protein